MTSTNKHDNEVALPFDPGLVADGTVAFIGHLSTPWRRGLCPKNLTEARKAGGTFRAVLDEPYRGGLVGLCPGMHIILLYWMAETRRDLMLQTPAHRPQPTGTFALRSPARPNPVGLAVVTLLALDLAEGILVVDACDAFDGTPLIDIKPWLGGVDIPVLCSTGIITGP